MPRQTLIHVSPEYIVNFVSENPVNWLDGLTDGNGLHYARIGGMGDSAGVTPTPAMEAFFAKFILDKALFTQLEYADYCFLLPEWKTWGTELHPEQVRGVKAKLFRNFYPSAVDSLHVYSMLVASGEFDSVYIDTYEDAIGKVDITVQKASAVYRLALYASSKASVSSANYKQRYRSNGDDVETDLIRVVLPMARPKSPGKKRWYTLDDVLSAIRQHQERKYVYGKIGAVTSQNESFRKRTAPTAGR